MARTPQQAAHNAGVVFSFLLHCLVIFSIIWGFDKIIGGVGQDSHDRYVSWITLVGILMGGISMDWWLAVIVMARQKRKARDKAERDALRSVLNSLYRGGTIGRPRPTYRTQNGRPANPTVIRADVTDLPKE